MAHKKHKSKQSAIDHADIAAKETARKGSDIAPQPLMSTKHDLSDDVDKPTGSERLKKRRKVNSNTGLHHHDPLPSDIPVATLVKDIQHPEVTPSTSSEELLPEVRHLGTKYKFTTMSIGSSAKINDRVNKLLSQVGNFSFADTKTKPGVVVLRAESKDASRMVSIVEIARQQIESDKGKWWQYSKLNGKIAEMKFKSVKRRNGENTLLNWEKKQAGADLQGVEEAGGEMGCASDKVEHDHELVDGDEEMEDAFETMVNPKEVVDQGGQHSGNGSGTKVRATPVMTIYFARVPVPGLKELYGYVLIKSIDGNY